jgi:hypothetical protein
MTIQTAAAHLTGAGALFADADVITITTYPPVVTTITPPPSTLDHLAESLHQAPDAVLTFFRVYGQAKMLKDWVLELLSQLWT